VESFSIGQVAQAAGVAQSAIRYYERLGLLPKPPRSGGWRRYDLSVVERVRVIRLARQLGFALEEIRILLTGFSPDTPPPERWRSLARAKLGEVDELFRRAGAMKRLLEAGLGCSCVRIEDCFLDDCSRPAPRPRALPIVAAG
jgi:MerR family redox-sensitive transcriptional activator SoxR